MRLFDSVVATLGLSQPFQRLVREVLMLLVIVPGRATFLNLSRHSRYDEKTFRRGFRREVHWAALNVAAIRAVAPAHHAHVLAFDPSFIPKSGKHTPGLGTFLEQLHRAGGTRFGNPCVGVGRRHREHGLCDSGGTHPARAGTGSTDSAEDHRYSHPGDR